MKKDTQCIWPACREEGEVLLVHPEDENVRGSICEDHLEKYFEMNNEDRFNWKKKYVKGDK